MDKMEFLVLKEIRVQVELLVNLVHQVNLGCQYVENLLLIYISLIQFYF